MNPVENNFAVRLGLAERFCLRDSLDSDLLVGCLALLNAWMKAYKPHRQRAGRKSGSFFIRGPRVRQTHMGEIPHGGYNSLT